MAAFEPPIASAPPRLARLNVQIACGVGARGRYHGPHAFPAAPARPPISILTPTGGDSAAGPAPGSAAQPSPAVRAEGVWLGRGDQAILRGASFAIAPGSFHMLLGGAGKTSLLQVLAILAKPDQGRLQIFGLDVAALSRKEAALNRRRIGYVFQEGRLFPHLSVRKNLDYGRRMNGHAYDAKEFARIAQLLDVSHLLDRRPRTLSGGERQRIAVGRALLTRPRLLLLDEPLASLDSARKDEILPYLVRLRDEARLPMVYVSHDAAELRQIATNVVRLDGGRVAATGGIELLD